MLYYFKSTNEKSEDKTLKWAPDTDKNLTGKPFGWEIYRFSRILIGQFQEADSDWLIK